MIKPDELDFSVSHNGYDYLKATLSASLSSETRARIDGLVQEVSSLKDIEKLLFCLLLPVDGSSQSSFLNASLGIHSDDTDLPGHGFELTGIGIGLFSPGGPSSLHLSNQVEQSQAYTWIMSHLEEDPTTCLRKDEVYEDYRAYCDKHHMKTLNTADFGKVMKRAFPNVKPRRLGQRGQSRYCYGGMRKRTEVQPPFLPDLTDEALGLSAAHASVGRSTTSPASSSGTSGDAHRRLHSSTSPLTRLLQPNGGESESTTWAEEPSVKSALGVRGTIVSDVAHILLEYAQQVFGLHFQSLFHLAQHLVANRYVNSRSRHAFSLIAHTATAPSTSLSPPPSAALAEAIQKGITKSAFDRVSTNRLKSDTPDRTTLVKQELENTPTDHSRSPARYQSNKPSMSTLTQSSNQPNSAQRVSMPTTTTSTPMNSSYKPYQPNFSPLLNTQTGSNGNVYAAAAALASQTAAAQASSPYLLQSNQASTQGLRHPSAAVALAAAAAVAARQHATLTSTQNASPAAGYGGCNLIPGRLSPSSTTSPFETTTPPAAHEKPNFQTPSTPLSVNSDNPYLSNYLSPANNSSVYTAHQQSSPYAGLQQPPAPLPPTPGARSPYTPMANPSTGVFEQSNYKRAMPPHPPVDAPGAYEPSPRFHLGGQSPNKRARYLSTASGSSGSSSVSAECSHPVNGLVPENAEPYNDSSASTAPLAACAPSPTSSGSSTRSMPSQHPLSASPYPGRSDGVGMASPYYSSRYEGLEMRSPAPHISGSSQQDRLNRLPKLTPAPRDPNLWPSPSNSMGQPNYNSPLSTPSTSVFRPPVTPFTLELEEEDDFSNLPRLGASPGPQIPPSSPTEFLPFYSEAASKSVKAKRRLNASQMSAGHNAEDGSSGASDSPKHAGTGVERHRFNAPDSHLETPPSSALVAPNNELGNMNSPNSSSDSDDPHNRTLTNFDHYGQVNTPLVPGGLADAPSPSNASSMVKKRENLQEELSTPDPAENSHSPAMQPDSGGSHSSKADVSITAF